MKRTKLTDHYVRSLKPPTSGRTEISDSVRPGLRLRVSPTGRKTWIFEKRIRGGTKRKHTLGPYPQISIGDARAAAAELDLEAIRGIDRIEVDRSLRKRRETEARERVPVRVVLEAYDQLHLSNLRTAEERRRMLNQSLESYLDTAIAELTRRDLQRIIDKKARAGAPVYANRHKAALSHFARFAWNRGYTASHIGDGLVGAVRETPRDRVLSIGELRAIWGATLAEKGVFGPLVRLLMLTAQRRGDISRLQWHEVDFDRHQIVLDGTRTKNGRAHITHLSEPALNELEALRSVADVDNPFVFSTNGRTAVSGFSVLKKRLDARLGPDFEPWRFHDFRTGFATAMAESGEPEGLVDRVLNHVAAGSAPSAVARVYNRSSQLPQRAQILIKWSDALLGSEITVVQLARSASVIPESVADVRRSGRQSD